MPVARRRVQHEHRAPGSLALRGARRGSTGAIEDGFVSSICRPRLDRANRPSPRRRQIGKKRHEPRGSDGAGAPGGGRDSGLDATIKFNFGEEGIIYHRRSIQAQLGQQRGQRSKITITVTRENFERIIDHKLNPKFALMTGKMRLKGDIRIAMRLDKVFGTG